jgi:C-terminal processing protease CtpA/Prc
MVVTRSVADEKIQKGAIITSINGIKIEKAIRKLSEYGYGVEKERLEYVAENLYTDAAEVLGLPESFALTFSDGTNVQVKGLTTSEMFKREKELEAKDNSQKTEESPIELKFLPKNVAYLEASTFDYDLEKYKVLLRDAFTQIKSSGARKLIIDVRENRGGNSVLGDALLDMFNRKPHKHFSMKWKKSVQYVERLKGFNAPIPDHYQKLKPGEVYVSKPGIISPGVNPLRFTGQVYVLSGRKTFSSGQMFLAVVKNNKLATVIGEETNEPGCRAGEVHMFSLPNSRLRVSSSVKYWTPPGGCNGARGIIPDVVITESPNDYLTEKDVILQTTLNLMKQRQ